MNFPFAENGHFAFRHQSNEMGNPKSLSHCTGNGIIIKFSCVRNNLSFAELLRISVCLSLQYKYSLSWKTEIYWYSEILWMLNKFLLKKNSMDTTFYKTVWHLVLDCAVKTTTGNLSGTEEYHQCWMGFHEAK